MRVGVRRHCNLVFCPGEIIVGNDVRSPQGGLTVHAGKYRSGIRHIAQIITGTGNRGVKSHCISAFYIDHNLCRCTAQGDFQLGIICRVSVVQHHCRSRSRLVFAKIGYAIHQERLRSTGNIGQSGKMYVSICLGHGTKPVQIDSLKIGLRVSAVRYQIHPISDIRVKRFPLRIESDSVRHGSGNIDTLMPLILSCLSENQYIYIIDHRFRPCGLCPCHRQRP